MDFTDWVEYEYQGELDTDYNYYLARKAYLDEFRPNIFITGLNPRWQMYKFLPSGINVMFSAAGFWDSQTKEWRKNHKFKRNFGIRWLDCGGFTMLNKFGDYPFSVDNYANLVARLKPHYYATMDYPCEPEISRSLGLMTNNDRIHATVEKAAELAFWENQLSGSMVPVIQGYHLEEYLHCLDLYDQAGLIRDYMAVGSMCRRISDKELGRLIPGIYHAAQRLGVFKLHFFGLKLSPSLEIYSDMIYSRDSAVAMDSYDNEIRTQREGRRFPRGQKEKQENFEVFLRRLDDLGLNYIEQEKYE
jgi:hypothetical protein